MKESAKVFKHVQSVFILIIPNNFFITFSFKVIKCPALILC